MEEKSLITEDPIDCAEVVIVHAKKPSKRQKILDSVESDQP